MDCKQFLSILWDILVPSGILLAFVQFWLKKRFKDYDKQIDDLSNKQSDIRTHFLSSQKQKEILLFEQRLDQVSNLARACCALSRFNYLVQFLKVVDLEELKKIAGDEKIISLMDGLIQKGDVKQRMKEYSSTDLNLAKIYLRQSTIKCFEVYELIMCNAFYTLMLVSIPKFDIKQLKTSKTLRSAITELVPDAKEGFDKFGESHGYYWANYFLERTLAELRLEINPMTEIHNSTEATRTILREAEKINDTVDSLQKEELIGSGWPKNIFKFD